jgi:hypothetical protein
MGVLTTTGSTTWVRWRYLGRWCFYHVLRRHQRATSCGKQVPSGLGEITEIPDNEFPAGHCLVCRGQIHRAREKRERYLRRLEAKGKRR